MSTTIVTLRRHDQPGERDLEVPADLASDRLLPVILQAVQWNLTAGQLQMRAEPAGIVIGPHESLSQAGVWTGACLTLEPRGTVHATPLAGPTDEGGEPAVTWRPLGAGAAPAEPAPGAGFGWKKIR